MEESWSAISMEALARAWVRLLASTGTPSGIGAARTPPRWLQPGDVVWVEIEKVGVLENAVVAET